MKKILASTVFSLSFIFATASAIADTDSEQSATASLSVINASFSVSDSDDPRLVTSIGIIKNPSEVAFQSIVLEIRYFDGKGNLVDVITPPIYESLTTPSKEIAFRVRDDAIKPKDAYVSQTVRVVSAVPKRKPENAGVQTNSSFFLNLLYSWGPMLLLIGVWLYCMRRMNRKDSPQVKAVALFEKQNTILENQNRLLERIALASETRNKEK